jgi:hypothetical protein
MSIKNTVSDMADLDLRLVNAWANFRTKISEFINNVDECTVDLHFESSLDPRTHYPFEPDEAVFISDIEISNDNKVYFKVPHGAKFKTFFPVEAELISATFGGEKKSLIEFVNGMYKEAFKEVPEAPTITILERKYLTTNADLRDLLNNAEDALKQYELNIERGKTYTKLDDYGMF